MIEHIKLAFDPTNSGPCLVAVFHSDTARTLYLLWRQGHMVDVDFPGWVLRIARQIEVTQPKTAAHLVACFACAFYQHDSGFLRGDVERFCPKSLLYFTGERHVTYEVTVT